jgi:proline iminopeptidase
VVIGSSPRRACDSQIVERYRELGGDEAALVMERTLRDPSPQTEQDWARVCAPLSRQRPPDEVLIRILAEGIHTPKVNAYFMATFTELDLRADLRNVRDPMLVLLGAADPLTPPHLAAEIQEHSGGPVTIHHLDDASYQVLWDQPQVTDRLLRAFVASLGLPS